MTDQKKIARRDLLAGAAAGITGTIVGKSLAAQAPAIVKTTRRPPNILVIMSDEHNTNILGCYGNKVARTPNIDGLAERGITFDTAYCNSPLCVPSRLSVLQTSKPAWKQRSSSGTKSTRFPGSRLR